MLFYFLAFYAILSCTSSGAIEMDPKGYVVYCPCMGRFGNQADHFLGSLAFAKGIDRTLVLPPWVEYVPRQVYAQMSSFDKYFKVEPLKKYHRVITMEKFMAKIAPEIWPAGNRTVLCYAARQGEKSGGSCNAKDGNPFGPFWDHFNIDFDQSEFFQPLFFDTDVQYMAKGWEGKYPASKWPVLAFTGAPASFPVSPQNAKLHVYLQWNNRILKEAKKHIENLERPLLGLHMRNGIDFNNVCAHVDADRHLFSSAQCLGFNMEFGKVTVDLCKPPANEVLNQIYRQVKKMGARSIFIATDNDPMVDQIKKKLRNIKVEIVTGVPSSPHTDLAILAMSDHYIGNCISSFSAFAARERLNKKLPCSFWMQKMIHDEL